MSIYVPPHCTLLLTSLSARYALATPNSPINFVNKYFTSNVSISSSPPPSPIAAEFVLASSPGPDDQRLDDVKAVLLADGEGGDERGKILLHICDDEGAYEAATKEREEYDWDAEEGDKVEPLFKWCIDNGVEYVLHRSYLPAFPVVEGEAEGIERVYEALENFVWKERIEKGKGTQTTRDSKEVPKTEPSHPQAQPPAGFDLPKSLTDALAGFGDDDDEGDADADGLMKALMAVRQTRDLAVGGGFKDDSERRRRAEEVAMMLEKAMGLDSGDGHEEEDERDDWDNAGDDFHSAETAPPPVKDGADGDDIGGGDDDEDWSSKIPDDPEPPPPPLLSKIRPLIIVNATKLTDGRLHCKHDPHSNSDPELASELRGKIEEEYDTYSNDASKISEGIVIPCGGSVWIDAVRKLKEENPGVFFLPVFKK